MCYAPNRRIHRRNPQYKKHKTWDGDAVLVVTGNKCALYDSDSRQYVVLVVSRDVENAQFSRLGMGKPYGIEGTHKLAEGVEFTLGSREIEIDHKLSREDFLSGRCFGRGVPTSFSTPVSRPVAAKQFVPLKPRNLNGNKSPSLTPSSAVKEKRGVDLELVSLVGNDKSAQKSACRESYWTANW